MYEFEEIYKKNYAIVFRIAQKMLTDKDEAADVVQEVFIYLFKRMNDKDSIKNTKSWLCRATINKCIDKQKFNNRFEQIETNYETANHESDDKNEQTHEELNKALSTLKPNEKALVILYSEGMSYKEMAEATGIKFTSIGKTLSRTLKKLEKELKTKKYELYR